MLSQIAHPDLNWWSRPKTHFKVWINRNLCGCSIIFSFVTFHPSFFLSSYIPLQDFFLLCSFFFAFDTIICFTEQLHINLHWTQYVSYLLSCNLTEDEARNQSHEKKEADVLIRSAKRHTSENQSSDYSNMLYRREWKCIWVAEEVIRIVSFWHMMQHKLTKQVTQSNLWAWIIQQFVRRKKQLTHGKPFPDMKSMRNR